MLTGSICEWNIGFIHFKLKKNTAAAVENFRKLRIQQEVVLTRRVRVWMLVTRPYWGLWDLVALITCAALWFCNVSDDLLSCEAQSSISGCHTSLGVFSGLSGGGKSVLVRFTKWSHIFQALRSHAMTLKDLLDSFLNRWN